MNAAVVYVPEGWWHYNCNAGKVHDHPEKPNRGWSETMHRLCVPVYTARTVPAANDAPAKTVGELIASLSAFDAALPVLVWHHGASGEAIETYLDSDHHGASFVTINDNGDC